MASAISKKTSTGPSIRLKGAKKNAEERTSCIYKADGRYVQGGDPGGAISHRR